MRNIIVIGNRIGTVEKARRPLRKLVSGMVPNSQLIYRLCKRYVDWFNGENNHNITSNGELEFMRRHLPECEVVFDIGANVGNWASLALSVNPNISLHCFEPSRVAFQHLLNKQFPRNVVCNNVACGARRGRGILYGVGEGKLSQLSAMYRRKELERLCSVQGYTEEIVSIETVDGYCREHDIEEVDFLKMDVEGYELQVFKGMAECLKEGKVRIVQFEYGGTYIDARVFLGDIWKTVLELTPNYRFYKLWRKGVRPVARYRQQLENFQLQNWVIIRVD